LARTGNCHCGIVDKQGDYRGDIPSNAVSGPRYRCLVVYILANPLAQKLEPSWADSDTQGRLPQRYHPQRGSGTLPGNMLERIPQFRIFLSSPGDVPAERKIALEVIDQLQYEPHFRGKVSLEPVAWDDPGAGTVMRATITPQEAIDQGLTRPADCDIVVVIFWARMGTQRRVGIRERHSVRPPA
jgi:hypothetical protein